MFEMFESEPVSFLVYHSAFLVWIKMYDDDFMASFLAIIAAEEVINTGDKQDGIMKRLKAVVRRKTKTI